MAKRPENSPDPSYGDSRLAEFLRRAKPILAAERGMTARSRIKLKALADELHLPQPQFDMAISQLQGSSESSQTELTRYEKQFVRFLEEQLKPRVGNVLTPDLEKRAIKHGQRDFQIEHDRARDLVRQVANRMGIGRVSRLDATSHVAALIDEAIGSATTASTDIRDRILKSAKPWGIDPKKVQILIDNRLEANLQSMRPRSSAWLVILAIVASVVVLALLVWLLWAQLGAGISRNGSAAVNGTGIGESTDRPDVAVDTTPDFWSPATQRIWQTLLASDRLNSVPRHLVLSTVTAERQQAIAPLLDLAVAGSEPIRKNAEQFLIRTIDEDRDISEPGINIIAARLAIDRESATLTMRTIEEAFRAADLLLQCRDQSTDMAVRERIDEAFARAFRDIDQPLTGTAQSIVDTQLTSLAWQRLEKLASQNKEAAARLYSPLLKLTQPRSDVAETLAWPVGLKIFFGSGQEWQLMREAWQVTFARASEDQLFQAFDVLATGSDLDRNSWLLNVLAARLGLSRGGLSDSRISEAIRAKFGLTSETWKPAKARWELLVDLPDYRVAIESDRQPTPQAIANAAWLSTAAFLLWQAEKESSPRFLASFDQIIADGPSAMSIRRTANQQWQSLPIYGRVKRRPLPSDIEARRVALGKLQNPAGLSSVVLAAALERLGGIADRFADVTPEQATAIVRFMLQARDDSEVVVVEKFASRFRHWPNLATALSEQVLEPDVSIDQAVTVASLLMELEFDLRDPANWRRELHRALLRQLADGLQHTAEVQGDDTDYQWDELHDYLVELARIRCQAVGVASNDARATDSPAELTRLILEQLIGDDPRIASTRMLADDDLQDAILTTLLLTNVVTGEPESSRRSGQGLVARDIQTCPAALLFSEQNLLLALVQERKGN